MCQDSIVGLNTAFVWIHIGAERLVIFTDCRYPLSNNAIDSCVLTPMSVCCSACVRRLNRGSSLFHVNSGLFRTELWTVFNISLFAPVARADIEQLVFATCRSVLLTCSSVVGTEVTEPVRSSVTAVFFEDQNDRRTKVAISWLQLSQMQLIFSF